MEDRCVLRIYVYNFLEHVPGDLSTYRSSYASNPTGRIHSFAISVTFMWDYFDQRVSL